MNYEQAVERLLRGEPWVKCAVCNGAANDPDATQAYREALEDWRLHARPAAPRAIDYARNCAGCHGDGVLLEESYGEACRVLDRPLPAHSRLIFDAAIQRLQELTLKGIYSSLESELFKAIHRRPPASDFKYGFETQPTTPPSIIKRKST